MKGPSPSRAELRPTPLEIATTMALGRVMSAPPLPRVPPRLTMRLALEEVLLEALTHSPCVVSFSGGRDSTGLLSLAVHVARREGLPLPVPVTLRFPDDRASDESAWQETAIQHLRLDDWTCLQLTDELDYVGPIARDVLRAHGVLFPPNAHFHAPIAARAAGGAVITGWGGDEMFGRWRGRRVALLLRGRTRPTRSDVKKLAFALAPASTRRSWHAARTWPLVPAWLRPDAQREWVEQVTGDLAEEPASWRRAVRRFATTRYYWLGRDALQRVIGDARAKAVHPFFDPRVLAASAHELSSGVSSREAGLRAVFGDVMPPATLARRDKSHFNRSLRNRYTADLLARWDESAVDDRIVDTAQLRLEWAKPQPDSRTTALLQAVWLAAERRAGRDGGNVGNVGNVG